MPRNVGTASGESSGRKHRGWDETVVGAVGNEASVIEREWLVYSAFVDSIRRTAVYVTRTHGGVGGGHREVSPYPELGRMGGVQWLSGLNMPTSVYVASRI